MSRCGAMLLVAACGCGRVGFTPSGAPPDAPVIEPVRVIQQATAYGPAPSSSLSANFPAAPAAGHVLVMVGATPLAGLASVTGGGASWTRITRSTDNANIELWAAVSDGSGDTVTIELPGGTGEMAMEISEWSGLAGSPLHDVAAARSGLASPATVGSITTTGGPRLLVFAAGSFLPNTFDVPTPGAWTALAGAEGGTIQQRSWYLLDEQGGTFAPTVTETQHRWDAVLVALMVAP